MKKQILLFNSKKELLGKMKVEDGRVSAEVSADRWGDGYEEFQKYLRGLAGKKLFRREQNKKDGIISEKRVEVQNDAETAVALSEAISRGNFSFGRVFAVIGKEEEGRE